MLDSFGKSSEVQQPGGIQGGSLSKHNPRATTLAYILILSIQAQGVVTPSCMTVLVLPMTRTYKVCDDYTYPHKKVLTLTIHVPGNHILIRNLYYQDCNAKPVSLVLPMGRVCAFGSLCRVHTEYINTPTTAHTRGPYSQPDTEA